MSDVLCTIKLYTNTLCSETQPVAPALPLPTCRGGEHPQPKAESFSPGCYCKSARGEHYSAVGWRQDFLLGDPRPQDSNKTRRGIATGLSGRSSAAVPCLWRGWGWRPAREESCLIGVRQEASVSKHVPLPQLVKALTATAGFFQSFYPSVSLDKVTHSQVNCRLLLNTVWGISNLWFSFSSLQR